MFIHCRNSNCENYYEDSCTKNLENKMVTFDEGGKCETFKKGKSSYYDEMKCLLCAKEVEPLDAHMGRINGSLGVCHIDCWNKHLHLKRVDKAEMLDPLKTY